MGRIGTPFVSPLFGVNNGTLLSSRYSVMCGIAHINKKELGIAALGSRDGPKVTLNDRHAHCMRGDCLAGRQTGIQASQIVCL